MSDGPSIDSTVFLRRLGRVQQAWKEAAGDTSLNGVDAILIVAGASDEDNPYRKSTAFQTWLLGYEFPSTFMLVSEKKIAFLAGLSRTKIVEPLKKPASSSGIEVQVYTRGKEAAANDKLWDDVFESVRNLKIGVFGKDKFTGKFVDEWEAFLDKDGHRQAFETVEVSPALASIMAVKESDEINSQITAAKASMQLMNAFVEEMQEVLDGDKKITHEKLAEKMEAKLESPKTWKNFDSGVKGKFDAQLAEWCYTPIIQSAGNYDLRPSAQSDDGRLKPGVILCSIGVRYKSYCANASRTFIVDPHQTQKDNIAFLLKVQAFVLEKLHDGVQWSDVHAETIQYIQTEKPDLAAHLAKTMGFLMGIDFKESTYNLTPKCQKTMKTDMIFNLSIGFDGIPDPNSPSKTYALLLADTVLVDDNNSKLLSDGIKTSRETLFQMNDEPQGKSSKSNGHSSPKKRSGARTAPVTATKTKLRQTNQNLNDAQDRRREHQAELQRKKHEEGLARFADGAEGAAEKQEKTWKRFQSYQREADLPDGVRDLQIVVDHRRATVILPINGYAVPFHIKTIKNAIKQEEGEHTTIRFMFVSPGQLTGKKEDTPFEDVGANFIRSLTYRSADNARFAETYKEILELRREQTKRDNEKKQRADLVDQDKLIEGRRARLHDTWLRPPFEGKRSTGDVEIHQNGIRWISRARSDHKLDITFDNIKHLIFQPCDNELVVLIHVHLHNPIMIGKKKAKDIQWMREASDNAFDETGTRKRRRAHEEDEIANEQEERRQRAQLNKEFKSFADKISDASKGRFDVDIPFRDLGFGGVPHRTSVTLQPTTECLISVIETPFFCVTLADIEIAHMERVQYGLKNFDLVIVFSDFSRAPAHINTIPMSEIEAVHDWLNSCDIATTEGPVNLNWGQIMKTVNDDPKAFYEEGGWGFLSTDKDDDESGSDSASSGFVPSGSESAFDDEVSSDDGNASADVDSGTAEEEPSASESDEE